MSKPNAITVSTTRRGTTVKARGAAAQVLFDALASKVDARINAARKVAHTLHFEDHGQDFLRWEVDANGVVTDAQPYQAELWAGCTVLNAAGVGEKVRFFSPRTRAEETLLYPVAKVVLHVPA